jgi:hypothetical protein
LRLDWPSEYSESLKGVTSYEVFCSWYVDELYARNPKTADGYKNRAAFAKFIGYAKHFLPPGTVIEPSPPCGPQREAWRTRIEALGKIIEIATKVKRTAEKSVRSDGTVPRSSSKKGLYSSTYGEWNGKKFPLSKFPSQVMPVVDLATTPGPMLYTSLAALRK